MRSSKEAKKPKAEKNQVKSHLSAYKQSQTHSGPNVVVPPAVKKP